eukprot:TRINITY_DN224_c0_g4_i1.p2 TRINITY_DN224_c0_g4~~TRINITY_DN224_c0_g4_i1.p2  ORF type:complete len:378 (-),score=54.47 TRINITY_DN224_c0_g4_i1:4217-5350(-)
MIGKLEQPFVAHARTMATALNSNSVKIVTSNSNNIIFNLATEEYLFEKSKILNPILFLWRNDKTIVIGKHQNPWKECRIKDMQRDNVNLARRKSGGGAVYQDLGNTCFSFLDPLDGTHSSTNFKELNTDVLLDALNMLGIPNAAKSGRNDIVIDGKKVSGSAYKFRPGDRTLHHGTMLINLDKAAASNYLNPSIEKLKSKGVESVKARIINLVEINPEVTHEKFCDAMREAYKKKHKGKAIEEIMLEESELHKIPEIEQIYKETSAWEWRFGETPEFSYSLERKFDWGLVEVCLGVQNAAIKHGKIYSDCLFPDFIDAFNGVLSDPKAEHTRKGWDLLATKMEEKFKSNEMYMKFLKDINGLVHEKLQQITIDKHHY